jgi:aspartyl-tRNA(Asn)/glutamyl-tRNA(Gln) amidotransferase subunit A
MHELGAGMAASDGDWATGRNPYDPDRIPGGSSSGSAVGVAAGMAPCALGTDAAGSVRMPAGNCNLVGLKPTFGLLSRDGLLPYCWALDTIATMTRTVTDAGFLLEACLGVSGSGAFTHSLEAPLNARRIGVPRRYFWDRDDLRSDVRSRCEEALSVLAGAGATLVEVDLPSVTWNDAIYTTLLAETYSIHGAGLRATPDLYGPWFRLHGLAGALVTADDLNRAHRLRARLAAEACAAFGDVEALVIPGQAVPATPFSTSFAKALTQPRSQFMRPWNVTGLPAIAVPCGFSEDGLPLSISFAGPYFGEAALLSIAAAYERETAFGRQRPNEARWAAA